MRKEITTAAVASILILAVILFSIKLYRDRQAKIEELRLEAAEYNEEQDRLRAEQSDEDKYHIEIEEGEISPCSVIIVCAEVYESMRDVIDQTEAAGYTGAIAISDDIFPGNDNCLSVKDISDMTSRGWEICISADSRTDVAKLYDRITAEGLPDPTALYYPTSAADYTQLEDALECGIKVVISHRAEISAHEGMWFVNAYGCSENNSRGYFVQSVKKAESVALTVGFEQERDSFDRTTYSSMLSIIGGYTENDYLAISAPSAAYERYFAAGEDKD